MKTIIDLHIHSGYARACSKDISIENLEKFAKIKGLNLLGTGDFCHPKWIKELKNKLTEDDTGILRTKTNFPFLLQFEISLMYSDGGKGRRIHNLVLAPNFDVVNQITEALLKKGRIDYDGRPIFGIPCADFVEMMKSISQDVEIIPAHCLLPNEKILCNPAIKAISNVNKGDKVLTHTGTYKQVSKTFARPYSGTVYKIVPYYFSEGITVTEEHPFLSIKTVKDCSSVGGLCKPNSAAKGKHRCAKEHFKAYKSRWVPAKDLEVNDVILYPRLRERKKLTEIKILDIVGEKDYRTVNGFILPQQGRQDKPIPNSIKVTPEFCRLVGYYLAEGYVNQEANQLTFSFGLHEIAYIQEVKNLMNLVFGIDVTKERHRHGVELIFYSKVLANLFANLFYSSDTKRAFSKKLPDWALYLSGDRQAEILRGWWRGDTGVSTSEILSTQMKLICLRLGIIPSVAILKAEKFNSYKKKIAGRPIKTSRDLFTFQNLSFYEDRHSLLEDPVFKKFKTKLNRRHAWIDENYAYIPIRQIKTTKYTGFVYNLEVEDDNSYVTPAATVHNCWTPWFGVFGEKTGFDSLEECFKDQTKHIHAIESGLSSDPQMNWRLSKLDKIQIVSFSDIHSFWPWRLGREATVLDVKELAYKNVLKAIRTGEGLVETIETDPSYGKYHFDGHRLCGVSLDPKDSKKIGEICPNCRKKLTVGVLSRVEELADRPEGFRPKDKPGYRSIIPLSEIICFSLGSDNPASRQTWEIYNKLIKKFGSEYNVVFDAGMEDLGKIADNKMAQNIINMREGKVTLLPGFDGIYGVPIFNPEDREKLNSLRLKSVKKEIEIGSKKIKEENKKQKTLADFK